MAGWGGHGRTGTLVALLLSSLYGVNAHVALEYTQALHDCRGNPQGVRSPQTRIQRDQVRNTACHPALEGIQKLLGWSANRSSNNLRPANVLPMPLGRAVCKNIDQLQAWASFSARLWEGVVQFCSDGRGQTLKLQFSWRCHTVSAIWKFHYKGLHAGAAHCQLSFPGSPLRTCRRGVSQV